jgi:hypothetical protein
MSRKARKYQDLGECRRCRQWRKLDTSGSCVQCRYLSTGGRVERVDEEDTQRTDAEEVAIR